MASNLLTCHLRLLREGSLVIGTRRGRRVEYRIPHLSSAKWDPNLTIAFVIAGAIGLFAGARITSRWVPGVRVKQGFGVLIVIATACKLAVVLF